MTGMFLVWSTMTYIISSMGYPRLIPPHDIYFSPTRRRIEPTNENLKDPNVAKHLIYPNDKYVVVPSDKATEKMLEDT